MLINQQDATPPFYTHYIAMSGSLGDGMTRNSLASLECSPVGLRESPTIYIDKFYEINTDLDILLYEK